MNVLTSTIIGSAAPATSTATTVMADQPRSSTKRVSTEASREKIRTEVLHSGRNVLAMLEVAMPGAAGLR